MPIKDEYYKLSEIEIKQSVEAINNSKTMESLKVVSKGCLPKLIEIKNVIAQNADNSEEQKNILKSITEAQGLIRDKTEQFDKEKQLEGTNTIKRQAVIKVIRSHLDMLQEKGDEFKKYADNKSYAKGSDAVDDLQFVLGGLCTEYTQGKISMVQLKACAAYVLSDEKIDMTTGVLSLFNDKNAKDRLSLADALKDARNSVATLNSHREWGIKAIVAKLVDLFVSIAPDALSGVKFFRPDTKAGEQARGLGKTFESIEEKKGQKIKQESDEKPTEGSKKP